MDHSEMWDLRSNVALKVRLSPSRHGDIRDWSESDAVRNPQDSMASKVSALLSRIEHTFHDGASLVRPLSGKHFEQNSEFGIAE
jgi:hypothetical protein